MTQKKTYSLQIPYLNNEGNPVCVEITEYDAESLVESGSHRILSAGDGYHVVSPIVSPAQNVVYQLGNGPM